MTRRPYVYVDAPVVTGPRVVTTVVSVILAAALLDAEAKADGCAYAVDWVECVEERREADAERAAELAAQQAARAAAREAAEREEDARAERERAVDDAAARGRCQFGGC